MPSYSKHLYGLENLKDSPVQFKEEKVEERNSRKTKPLIQVFKVYAHYIHSPLTLIQIPFHSISNSLYQT